ncbi:hypothetical protein H0H81_006981 [Sphagnurus paluster]|uniref:F-box domain-containing protein n=1 Tax=Sphagnurus paluster TaxID=117069 RepID=A0A9P7KKN2_9AGAR|nr:hypothetical protein H0H81_006981 [Sphagnurus paluster]
MSGNCCATKAEVPLVRQAIKELLQKRTYIESRVELFKILLDDLHRQLDNVNEDIRSHHLYIYGIHSLPPELIQKIFFFCLPSTNCAMVATEAPLVLTRVCRQWREAALSTPELWSRLHISVPLQDLGVEDKNNGVMVRYGQAITTWLDRSGNLPLSISFIDDRSSYLQLDYEETAHSSISDSYILGVIASFSHRWAHINLNIAYHHLHILAHLTETDVPLLRKIQIEILRYHGTDSALGQSLPLLRAPSIKEISFWNGWSSAALSSLATRWENLSTLSIISTEYRNTELFMDTAATVLNRCQNLVKCHIQMRSRIPVDDFNLPEPLQLAPIELLHLQELRVRFDGVALEQDITAFFHALVVPEIRHLELRRHQPQALQQLPFMPLLLRPHKIDTMSFVADGCTMECLLDFLRSIPSLRRLALHSPLNVTPHSWLPFPLTPTAPPQDLEYVRLNEVVLNHLTPNLPLDDSESDSSTALCPSLEEIEFRFSPDVVVSDDAIIRFLRSRTTLAPEGVARLTNASFFLKRAVENSSSKIHPEMRPERETGLNLNMSYYSQRWIDRLTNIYPIFTPFREIRVSEPYDDWKPRFMPGMFEYD